MVWAKAAIIYHCLYTLSANVNTVKKEMTSRNYNKNDFDLADPLKGSSGLPEVHRPHFENRCTVNLPNWISIYSIIPRDQEAFVLLITVEMIMV